MKIGDSDDACRHSQTSRLQRRSHTQRPAESLVLQLPHTPPCNAPQQPRPLSLNSEVSSYKPAMQESCQAFPVCSENSRLSLCCIHRTNVTENERKKSSSNSSINYSCLQISFYNLLLILFAVTVKYSNFFNVSINKYFCLFSH